MAVISTQLQMVRGDTMIVDAVVKNNGSPMDITGADVWFTVKANFDDDDVDAIFQKTTSDGITLTTPATGNLRIEVEPSDTASLEGEFTDERFQTYFWDCQLKTTGNQVFTIGRGKLLIYGDTTFSTT